MSKNEAEAEPLMSPEEVIAKLHAFVYRDAHSVDAGALNQKSNLAEKIVGIVASLANLIHKTMPTGSATLSAAMATTSAAYYGMGLVGPIILCVIAIIKVARFVNDSRGDASVMMRYIGLEIPYALRLWVLKQKKKRNPSKFDQEHSMIQNRLLRQCVKAQIKNYKALVNAEDRSLYYKSIRANLVAFKDFALKEGKFREIPMPKDMEQKLKDDPPPLPIPILNSLPVL